MREPAGTPPMTQTDEGFEARRMALVWQALKPDRIPHAIWPALCEEDIVDALAHARSRGLRVSIVSGGHSYIGQGIQNGTLLLDLSRMTGMEIDAERQRGWVEPGVRVAEFDAELERAGLAFPIGHDPNVGLVGYLLGGGMGWNPESWGSMGCFNVTAAEIVLASGERVVADAEHHTDLFWAVRGAGPNFCGVVTRFHVQLFPRPAVIRKSDYIFSLDALESVLVWLANMQESLDDRIELSLVLFNGTDETGSLQRQCSVSLIVFTETEIEAAGLSEPYARSIPVEGLVSRQDAVPRTFATLLDEAKGDSELRRAVESVWTDDPYSAARAAAALFASVPSPDCVIYIGLRKRRDLFIDAACSMLGRGFVFIDAAWRLDDADAINRQWVDSVLTRLHPFEKGGYINETDWDRHPERVAKCYSPDALLRLKGINRRHDPTGVFVKPFDFS
jgi:FAD/FMN-containing dehydrogenase